MKERMAQELMRTGTFSEAMYPYQMTDLLGELLIAVMENQQLAGVSVNVEAQVREVEIDIHRQRMQVMCDVRIQQPISAGLIFQYTLENDKRTRNLQLVDEVTVDEDTGTFDVIARTTLKMLEPATIAQRELSDPAGLIKDYLPRYLADEGFTGRIKTVGLYLTRENQLRIEITTITG